MTAWMWQVYRPPTLCAPGSGRRVLGAKADSPPDAKPPLDLNREMMEKYRPAMRQFYLNKRIQFR